MRTVERAEIVSNKNQIAYCGLYCGACRSFLNKKCPGCHENEKASWCKIRECCKENNFQSCADCDKIELKDCKKFNNWISKVFGIVFDSDRAACINRIKEIGYDDFGLEMTSSKRQTISRKKRTIKH
jgi:hypothetical protein